MISGNTLWDGLMARPDTLPRRHIPVDYRSERRCRAYSVRPGGKVQANEKHRERAPVLPSGHRRPALPGWPAFTCVHFGRNEIPVPALSRPSGGDPGTLEHLPIILVVEDDQLLQRVVEETLTDGGFEIVIAVSGENAIELLDTADGKYRALVTDINLGRDRMNGWDIARHAREIDPNFPVVYMSGDSAEDWSSRGVPDSIMLSKPFAPAQLVTAVSQVLNSAPPAAS